jgi:MFS family permease
MPINFLSEPERPTRARFVLLAYLCAMALILYLDRVSIAQATVPMQAELGISNTSWGVVLVSFTFAYGLFEVPTGRMGDRYGSRRVLTRIVAWWSVFTAMTGACFGFYSLVVVRFLFGAGEAGAYPNVARILARWYPVAERGRVQGAMLAFSLVGAALAPTMAQSLMDQIGWRWTFGVFGAIGLIWSAAFYLWFRDDPAESRAVSALELEHIGAKPVDQPTVREPIPWRAALANRNIWLLSAIVVCAAFTTYVFYSWFPKYLQTAREASPQESGWMSTFVLGVGAVAMFVGGWVGDAIASLKTDRKRMRERIGLPAYMVAAGCLAGSTRCESAWVAVLFAAVAYSGIVLMQTIWWSCATEVSGRHIGALFGLLNSAGVFGAMGSQFFFGAFTDWRAAHGHVGRDQWDPAFFVCAGLLFCGGVFWWFVDPSKKVQAAQIVDRKTTRDRFGEEFS